MFGAVTKMEQSGWVPPVGFVTEYAVDRSPAEDYENTTWIRLKDTILFAAGDTFQVGDTGGAVTAALTVDNLPAHDHPGSTSINGNHIHTVTAFDWVNATGYGHQDSWQDSMGWQVNTSTAAGDHAHTATLGAMGGGQEFSILNPYTAVNVWERVG